MKKKYGFAQCFIGKHIKIISSKCQSLIGIEGKIIDETKNIFKINSINGEKQLNKSEIIFLIDDVKINGKDILKLPSERLKLRIKNE
jgi:ribonuclease P protein subunit POP4